MVKVTALALFLSFCGSIYAQKVVTNISIIDVDDYYLRDSLITKNGFKTSYISHCDSNQIRNNNCIVICKSNFNVKGELIEIWKGEDLNAGKLDYNIQYSKINDSTFQSLVRYPAGSTKYDGIFSIDSIVEGTTKRVCIFKKDKDKNIYIRSVFHLNHSRELIKTERFNLDNKLLQIFYPTEISIPEKEINDTLKSQFTTEYHYTAYFKDHIFESSKIYNNHQGLIENRFSSTNSNKKVEAFSKLVYMYNKLDLPVIKFSVDQFNKVFTEEKFYYKDSLLIRQTKYEDVSDPEINEESLYDKDGNMIYYFWQPLNSSNAQYIKGYYSSNGLKEREDYFLNGTFQSSNLYSYK